MVLHHRLCGILLVLHHLQLMYPKLYVTRLVKLLNVFTQDWKQNYTITSLIDQRLYFKYIHIYFRLVLTLKWYTHIFDPFINLLISLIVQEEKETEQKRKRARTDSSVSGSSAAPGSSSKEEPDLELRLSVGDSTI